MERLASPPEEAKYVSWEEVSGSSESGRTEVRYYLRRNDGGTDLAVVGKERSLRHMSYHYGNRIRSLSLSMGPLLKLRTRREVIDWLNSIVSDSSHQQSYLPARSLGSSYDCKSDVLNIKDPHSQKIRNVTGAFSWLGSPWMCRRKRKHFPSFHRNGVKISVYDFVYVLAEEGKRLVAYLEDMYEDSKGSKMVVVRWFHKIDEVGITLPHNYNDREVFFSLCLQELSVECIDGLAVILTPLHFEKFKSGAAHSRMNPFICYHLFEDDEVRPFNVTRMKGYWNQEIVRHMVPVSGSRKDQAASQQFDHDDEIRPRKRHCRSRDDGLHSLDQLETGKDKHDLCSRLPGRKLVESCPVGRGETFALLSNTEAKENPHQHLKVGRDVEVLSQDSGIRGCWFRARIIKKRKDKVKVRYEDIQDAADEAKKLEEWMLASRLANPDKLGIRIAGRKIVRPAPELDKECLFEVNTGTAVDVWWHDGWWEGIVTVTESDHRARVFFPGENKEAVFVHSDLRQSQEWLGKGWIKVKARSDIVGSISSRPLSKPMESQPDASKLAEPRISDPKHHSVTVETDSSSKLGSDQQHSRKGQTDSSKLGLDCRRSDDDRKEESKKMVLDLSKDDLLTQLRWKSSRKRRRSAGGGGVTPASDLKINQKNNSSRMSLLNIPGPNTRLLISNALSIDHDNCKYMRDSNFGSSAVQPLTSLVMSR